ncbi:MAG: sodium:proton exchanger [Desulfobacterales bacterium]|nr:sodium:proton exchanger [Desulfobacterales bacterium]
MKEFLIQSIGKLDMVCWGLVVLFFGSSALIFQGNLPLSLAAALGVVFTMILIALSIEVIIETLKDIKGIGTITGFITNGPELVCLIVGLSVGDILFAASTPLGSNFMNPVLLFVAALVCRTLPRMINTHPGYGITCTLATAGLAVAFYRIPTSGHVYWIWTALALTLVLFFKRPPETPEEGDGETIVGRWAILPASALLISAGYLLDPMVSFASAQSHAPKGVIGFFVLATLSSWPEFKTCLVLLRRQNHLAALLNITVSNITNIWLALGGVITHLLVKGI